MSRNLSWIPTLLLCCFASRVEALTVIVPDDHPTIQAALDAGADVIQVRGGLVPERLTITRTVTLEPGPAPDFLGSWAPTPMVRSLEVRPGSGGETYSPNFTVRGVRFLGEVRLTSPTIGYCFESCRFDSGLTDPTPFGMAGNAVSVRNCMFLGDARVAGAVQFAGNTVIGCTARIFSDGSHDISHNYVTGPAEVGLELRLSDSAGPIAMNTIRGTGDGIVFTAPLIHPSVALRNDISDCSGDGIVFRDFENRAIYGANLDSNLIVDCGGAGVAIRHHPDNTSFHRASMTGNTILNCGQEGVRLERTYAYPARGNTILDSGGDGFVTMTASRFEGNIIGRSGGAGLKILGEPASVFGNTIFSNAGAGIHLVNSYCGDSVRLNVSAFNGGPGILLEGGAAPVLGCNDWFANAGGATEGLAPDPTDLALHPLFCDLAGTNVHLASNSPLLDAAGCGLIGALGEGCGEVLGVGDAAPSKPASFRAWPVPAAGTVAFSLPPSEAPAELEIFDVAGARRWQGRTAPGEARATWNRQDLRGRSVEPGVYFARLRRSGVEVARARIVLTE